MLAPSFALFALELIGALASLPAPTPPPASDGAWRVVKVVDGVTLKQAPSSLPAAPWGMGEGEVAAPLARVVAHLTDFGGLTRFIPRLETARVIQKSGDQAVVYFRFDLPWPISDRDWTVRYRFGGDGAGGFRMQWVDANELGPPPRGTVRVSPVRGAWELTPTGRGTTLVRYVFLAQLGGHLTRGIIEQTVWKQPLQTIVGVRRAVSR
jgi:hypothetical protein